VRQRLTATNQHGVISARSTTLCRGQVVDEDEALEGESDRSVSDHEANGVVPSTKTELSNDYNRLSLSL